MADKIELIRARVKNKLLKFINGLVVPMSAREISKRTGVGVACVYKHINKFQSAGLVNVQGSGNKGARLFIGA